MTEQEKNGKNLDKGIEFHRIIGPQTVDYICQILSTILIQKPSFKGRSWTSLRSPGGLKAFHCTPLQFNMEPKNHPTEKENLLPNLHFQVPCLNFRGVDNFHSDRSKKLIWSPTKTCDFLRMYPRYPVRFRSIFDRCGFPDLSLRYPIWPFWDCRANGPNMIKSR